MSVNSDDLPGKAGYLRAVSHGLPLQARHADAPEAFSNSSIDRQAYPFADRPNARDFETLLAGYMWSGGIARSGEVARRLEALQPGSMVSIERLIAANAVFAFDWRGSLWLPMFQFGPGAMLVNPHARRVLTELASVFDGWAIACWFLDANLWLQGRRPIDMLESAPAAVLAAARGDRFIATDLLRPAH